MPNINIGILATGATKGAKQVNKALTSIGNKGRSLISGVFTPLNAVIGALGGTLAIAGLAKTSDEFVVMANRLEYLTGSAEGAAKAEEELYNISKLTGTKMSENADTFTKLALASEMTGLSMEENMEVLGGLNALMIKTGTSGQQASNAMLQLSQGLASGVLQGDEFRSMAENAPGVLSELAKAIGVPRSALKKMGSEGELTSKLLGEAFLKISRSAKGSMTEDLPETVAQGWNAVVLAFQEAWDEINDQTGIMSYLRIALLDLATWIEDKTPVFVEWFEAMVLSMQENWPAMRGVFEDLYDKVSTFIEYVWENRDAIEDFFVNMVSFGVRAYNKLLPIFDFLIETMQTLSTVAKYTPGAAYTRAAVALGAGGNIIDAGAAFFDAEGGIQGAAERGAGAATDGGGGGTTNINISQQQSRSDVSTIINEAERQTYRGG